MSALRRFLKVAGVAAAAAAIAHFVKERLVPEPEPLEGPAPPFRTAPTVAGGDATTTPPADDLTAVHGIGPVYAGRLAEMGIASFQDLAAASAEEIADAVGVAPEQAADWVTAAADLVG